MTIKQNVRLSARNEQRTENKMSTETEIKTAIAASSSTNTIVRLSAESPRAALDAIDNDENVTELDWTDAEVAGVKVLDVWGKRMGSDFRLYITKA